MTHSTAPERYPIYMLYLIHVSIPNHLQLSIRTRKVTNMDSKCKSSTLSPCRCLFATRLPSTSLFSSPLLFYISPNPVYQLTPHPPPDHQTTLAIHRRIHRIHRISGFYFQLLSSSQPIAEPYSGLELTSPSQFPPFHLSKVSQPGKSYVSHARTAGEAQH